MLLDKPDTMGLTCFGCVVQSIVIATTLKPSYVWLPTSRILISEMF